VTQTYDSGSCVYFYFAFNYNNVEDPVGVFEEIEKSAREEILLNGGSISHHHGVGKVRETFVDKTISPAGIRALQFMKKALDPDSVFGNGNLLKGKL
jgi:alkyldihydroxyacetonephosphate synthase